MLKLSVEATRILKFRRCCPAVIVLLLSLCMLGGLAIPSVPTSARATQPFAPVRQAPAMSADWPLQRWPTWTSYDRHYATAVAPCDVNLDGFVDLIIAYREHWQDGFTRVYLNDHGRIAADAGERRTHISRSTEALAVADLNRDGYCDLVLGNDNQPLDIYINQRGNFPDTPSWSSAWSMPVHSLAAGDVNGDSWIDLAVAGYNGRTLLFLNDHGAFGDTAAWISPADANTLAVTLADIDLDGRPDLIQGNEGQPAAIYHNEGGLFTAAPAWNSEEVYQTTSVASADINQDGWPDLITAHRDAPLHIYYSHNGTFAPRAESVSSPLINTTTIAAADLDYDGDPDIVTGGRSMGNDTQYVRVFQNDHGQLTQPPVWISAGTLPVSDIELFDVNNDSMLDLVAAVYLRQSQIFINTTGGFSTQPVWQSDEREDTNGIALLDADRDGDLDLLAGGWYKPIRLYRNDGGRFTTQPVWTATMEGGTYQVAVGDYNNDGYPDFALATIETVRVFRNMGGTFAGYQVWSSELGSAFCAAWADMDGDGDLDLLVGNVGGASQIYLYENENTDRDIPQPRFRQAWVSSPPYEWTRAIAAADIDQDGDQDMILVNNGQASRLLRNDGLDAQGNLILSEFWRTPPSYSAASRDGALTDINGDSWVDVVIGNDGQPTYVFLNDHGAIGTTPAWASGEFESTYGLATGDLDGNGFNDLVTGNRTSLKVYYNQGGQLPPTATWSATVTRNGPIAVGDVNGDGAWDIVAGGKTDRLLNANGPVMLYTNLRAGGAGTGQPIIKILNPDQVDAAFFSTATRYHSPTIDILYEPFEASGTPIAHLSGEFSLDGGGSWRAAVPTTDTLLTDIPTVALSTQMVKHTPPLNIPSGGALTDTLVITEPIVLADLDVTLTLNQTQNNDLAITLIAPDGTAAQLLAEDQASGTGLINTRFDDTALRAIQTGAAPYSARFQPKQPLDRFRGHVAQGTWQLVVRNSGPGLDGRLASWGLSVRPRREPAVYQWDIAASGMMGASDNVVFRLTAIPGHQPQPYEISGAQRYGAYATSTYPFGIEGSQIKVTLPDLLPAIGAIVYNLPKDQSTGGTILGPRPDQPYRTNGQGYLEGRGFIKPGDRLLALLLDSATLTSTLYLTNGTPTEAGLDTFTVERPGLQELTVSAAHPLLLFNLSVSLEWDASQDPDYLQRLQFNLRQASKYLYDFTNGQVALGQISVFQNADNWATSDVVVHASNRLRPFASQGGIVLNPTTDLQHPTIVYDTGQVHIGSTWSRYGTPGQNTSDDWALILAHELSHYLFFLDDTYLGINNDGLLFTTDTCTGSAMGDLYRPDNTEFIADPGHWRVNCADTLAAQELERTEWETLNLWYPQLVTPTVQLAGPTLMPFNLTDIAVTAPLTPSQSLDDPTFFLDYVGGGVSSTAARSFLINGESTADPHDDYVADLGSPTSGQNRVLARGAAPGNRLCVFDDPRHHFGCERITLGDNRLPLKQDSGWPPAIQVTPVTSTTYQLQVATLPASLPLKARLFPEYGPGEATIDLTASDTVYSGTLVLSAPTMTGHIQLWVDEQSTEAGPRREIIIPFSVGGNPGFYRGGGGFYRGGGGFYRGGGGFYRGGGGFYRGGGGFYRTGSAPLLSSDGQMTFFTNANFEPGEFYMIQGTARIPALPPGKQVIGQSYELIASAGTSVISGSVTIQYAGSDVLLAGAREDDLRIGFWNGSRWQMLPTLLDSYYDLVSATSMGSGVYALLIGTTVPQIDTFAPAIATNDLSTTLLISGSHFLDPAHVRLVSATATYTMPTSVSSSMSLQVVVPAGLPVGEYRVEVINGDGTTTITAKTFALYPPTNACFSDFFESGTNKWLIHGSWANSDLPDGNHMLNDSPGGPYASAAPPAATITNTITSMPFSLAGCAHPVLTFRHDYLLAKLASSQDIARVELSTDNGASWVALASYTGGRIYDTYALPQATGDDREWADAEWKPASIDLSGFSGDQLRLRFVIEADQVASDRGWIIDDVQIRNGQPSYRMYLPFVRR